MGTYAALALLVVVAALTLRPLGRPYGTVVVMAGSVMLLIAGVRLLEPVLQEMTSWGQWLSSGGEELHFALSLTGTALVGDMACRVCRQAGEEELAHACAWIGKVILIGMALPMLLELLDLLYASFSWL